MLGRIARRLAGQAARQVVANAKSQHAASQQSAPHEPDVAVLFAMRLEAAPTWDRMDASTSCRVGKLPAEAGRLGKAFCVAAVGGVGKRATSAIRQLLELQPALVVSAGLGGALDPSLRCGDVIIGTSVADEDGGDWALPQSETLGQTLQDAEGGSKIKLGRLLTTQQVVRLPSERETLAQSHGAIICDMETARIAKACAEADVPLVALRCVSDEASEELPADVATLLDQTTTASRLGAAAGAVFRSPGRAVDLWKLRQSAHNASVTLAEVLVQLFG